MLSIGALVSGGGTNLQAIIDAIERGKISARISVVISNVPDVYALDRARKHNIDAVCIPHKGKTREMHEAEILKVLKDHNVGLVVLAGYLRMLTPGFVREFKGRLMNIHPALLPSFGGPGMHGENVHKAILEKGCKLSGCTVHFVDEGVDTGPIIVQKCVPVVEGDSTETLATRVLEKEHEAYIEAVRLFAEGRLKIEGGRVRVEGSI